LTQIVMAQQARSLAAEAVVTRVADLLADAHIEFVIVKGPAVSRLHPAGWARTYNDIDLLVEPRRFGQALELLLESGYDYPATSLPPRPWFDRYCREGLNLLGAGNVDLHHHVAPWVFGARLRSREVIDRATCVQLRGRSVPVASAGHSSVIAALHILNDLWKGRRGLVSWRDLIVIIYRSGFATVREAFGECGLVWLLDAVVATIRAHLPELLGDVDTGPLRVPPRFAWRMRGLGWDRSTPLSRHRLAWALRLPLPQAGAFLFGSGLPSRQYIQIRHGTYRAYWSQAWSETLSTIAGGDHRMERATPSEAPTRLSR
ncbi:MAG: nucleotidyltransferase family protein, partial [Acidimicrobiales bacterium]